MEPTTGTKNLEKTKSNLDDFRHVFGGVWMPELGPGEGKREGGNDRERTISMCIITHKNQYKINFLYLAGGTFGS